MRSRSSERSLGAAYSSGLSRSYGTGLNSGGRPRQGDRYICKSDYGQTRYRTRQHETIPRYNTISGSSYKKRERQGYPSYRGILVKRHVVIVIFVADRTRSAPPGRRWRSRSEDPSLHRYRESRSTSPWRARSYYPYADEEQTNHYRDKTRSRYSEQQRYARDYQPPRNYARSIYAEPRRYLPT